MAQPVSPAQLKQIQDVFDCWNDGDFTAMLAMWADDGDFDVSAVFADVPPARGHGEILKTWEWMHESMDGLRMDPLEVFSFGPEVYVADMRLWGRGRASGAAVDRRYGYLCEFRQEDGKCVRSQLLPDVETALANAERGADVATN